MADYQLTAFDGCILRTSDGALIPTDPANHDYVDYLAWAAAGNAPDPHVPPPPPVPASITDWQFFQQLATQGVITRDESLAAVKAGTISTELQTLVINRLPADQQYSATMYLSGATTFDRDHPKTLAIGHALGWTSDQMDALWRAAAEL